MKSWMSAKNKLKEEQKAVDEVVNNIAEGNNKHKCWPN